MHFKAPGTINYTKASLTLNPTSYTGKTLILYHDITTGIGNSILLRSKQMQF